MTTQCDIKCIIITNIIYLYTYIIYFQLLLIIMGIFVWSEVEVIMKEQ